MKAGELIERLEAFAPEAYACDWDNPGLLAGSREKEVGKVLVALDVTYQVVEEVISGGFDFLLTHHPLIFKPLSKINADTATGRFLLALIKNDVAYYAMHTNFDCAPGGMGTLAAEKMGLMEVTPLEAAGITAAGTPYGIGVIGKLPQPVTLSALCGRVKEAFGLPFLTLYPGREENLPVKTIAICPGSGKSVIKEAWIRKADVLLTGDIGHHEGLDAVAAGLTVLDGGHYGLEHMFVPFMADYIKKTVPELEIKKAEVSFPCMIR